MTMFEFLTQEEVGLVSNQVLLSSSSAVSATEYRSCGRAGAWGAGSELQEPASGHICTISATLGYSRLLSATLGYSRAIHLRRGELSHATGPMFHWCSKPGECRKRESIVDRCR